MLGSQVCVTVLSKYRILETEGFMHTRQIVYQLGCIPNFFLALSVCVYVSHVFVCVPSVEFEVSIR